MRPDASNLNPGGFRSPFAELGVLLWKRAGALQRCRRAGGRRQFVQEYVNKRCPTNGGETPILWERIGISNAHLDELDGGAFPELRGQAGDARVSVQEMVAYVPRAQDRAPITKLATQRFPSSKPVVGNGPELVERFQRRAKLGVERTYVWFCDFASAETLAGFGEEVIGKI